MVKLNCQLCFICSSVGKGHCNKSQIIAPPFFLLTSESFENILNQIDCQRLPEIYTPNINPWVFSRPDLNIAVSTQWEPGLLLCISNLHHVGPVSPENFAMGIPAHKLRKQCLNSCLERRSRAELHEAGQNL